MSLRAVESWKWRIQPAGVGIYETRTHDRFRPKLPCFDYARGWTMNLGQPAFHSIASPSLRKFDLAVHHVVEPGAFRR